MVIVEKQKLLIFIALKILIKPDVRFNQIFFKSCIMTVYYALVFKISIIVSHIQDYCKCKYKQVSLYPNLGK
jgi:hypothetical protein